LYLLRQQKTHQTELSEKIVQLKLLAPDGKKYETDCANTEGIFRIIQSIPSPKAEPFKRWLARVGYERIQEIEDPELGTKRTRALYRAKGYLDAWIEQRMRGIEIREILTDEWRKRNVKEGFQEELLGSWGEGNKQARVRKPSTKPTNWEFQREELLDEL